MILLVGPNSWVEHIGRMLSDRTTHSPANKVVQCGETNWANAKQRLRGIDEHIEVIECTGGWTPTASQKHVAAIAAELNRRREERMKK